ncbi:M3 family oligoendopeptidase [Deinococcus sp. KNUC1210]|uniref:M3 family oligoendopeptidase n=1 Tax=Deinococcus sp. KNUC1210 TaxID=2917691 RepID=UPI001EF0C296|nr:M3 family oligoendopeptidase [Deinococcus sp. KNUC1210]ULH15028.1 M3 family oligoendopeptidase [Deinococcus sp. KNUC1210]
MTAIQQGEPFWRTDDLYPGLDSAEYTAALSDLRARVTALGELFDALGIVKDNQTADVQGTFEQALTALNELMERQRPTESYAYAFSTDTRSDLAQARISELTTLMQPLSPLITRFQAWLGGLDLDALKQHSELARSHSYVLERARDAAQHQMSPAEEELASELNSSGSAAWGKLHGNLSSLLTGEVGGQRLPITAIRNLASDERAEVRAEAYRVELETWQSAEIALAAAMNGIKGSRNVLNRRRGYTDAVQPTLMGNSIDAQTLAAMQQAVTASFPDFRRYFAAKARRLGHADGRLPWSDLFAPVGEPGREWSYHEAQNFVENSFRRYSDRLGDFAARAFREDWLDVPAREGKRGGAFCMGWKRGESRILLNYSKSLDSVSTLAHELGHGYHNLCLKERTPLQAQTPMTLAETASIFCETIVQGQALGSVTGDERLYVLETSLMGHAQVVVDIHSRFLFESAVFEAREKRDLSPAELCRLMENAQQATYGDALSSLHPYMWAVKPHYYGSSFYNYPYTFGLLFGLGLYARYQHNPDSFRTQYDDLLSRTGMGDAATLAASFGIDTRDEAFWQSSLDVIRANISEYVDLVG